jgi:hypothetical protein
MMAVSNQAFCHGVTEHIGYYYKINFPVYNDSTYTFDLPVSFGNGGIIKIDGKEIMI